MPQLVKGQMVFIKTLGQIGTVVSRREEDPEHTDDFYLISFKDQYYRRSDVELIKESVPELAPDTEASDAALTRLAELAAQLASDPSDMDTRNKLLEICVRLRPSVIVGPAD